MADEVKLTPKQQAESAAYGGYLARYQDQPHLKARPARTGWTRQIEGYKVLLWGSSAEDWLLFCLCFMVLYGCLLLFYWLMFELYLTNVEDNVAAYIFFAVGFVAAGALALVVHWGNEERELRKKQQEREEEANRRAEDEAFAGGDDDDE